LLRFIAQDYPELLELYCCYSSPACRADAARYMLLHRFGGLYADIDVECLSPLAQLEDETRVVLCHEPPSHWPLQAPHRGHPYSLFNGVIASPAGHPFWRRILDRLPETRHGNSVIDMTGPCFLTGVYLDYEDKDAIRVESCHLFTPTDRSQEEAPYAGRTPPSLTRHYWAATWLPPAGRKKTLRRALVTGYHSLRYRMQRGPALDPKEAQRQIDASVLEQAPPDGDRLAVLVPVRNAADHVDAFVDAVSALDLPKEKTKLVFFAKATASMQPAKS
jgi:hypothetical protein